MLFPAITWKKDIKGMESLKDDPSLRIPRALQKTVPRALTGDALAVRECADGSLPCTMAAASSVKSPEKNENTARP